MAKTGHPNFDYTMTGQWRGILKRFSITGNHSGTSFGATDAETFMTGTSSPYALSFGPFQHPQIKMVEARYYDGQNSAPVWQAAYDTDNPPPTPCMATGLAWAADPAGVYLNLETCAMLQAQVGISKTSKPIYCRKYLRGIGYEAISDAGTQDAVFQWTAAATPAVQAMGDGSWFGGRVYISPNARQAIGSWEVETQIYAHQIPRGRKRKVTTQSNDSLVNTILNLLTSNPVLTPPLP